MFKFARKTRNRIYEKYLYNILDITFSNKLISGIKFLLSVSIRFVICIMLKIIHHYDILILYHYDILNNQILHRLNEF